MGILATILGSGNVVSKGMDLIDSFHTSDTEMVEAKTKAKVDMMKAYAPFKIAQRFLALMFGFTFIGCFVLVLVMTLMGYSDINAVRQVIAEFQIGYIMLMIVGFYFGGGMLEGYQNSKKEKDQR